LLPDGVHDSDDVLNISCDTLLSVFGASGKQTLLDVIIAANMGWSELDYLITKLAGKLTSADFKYIEEKLSRLDFVSGNNTFALLGLSRSRQLSAELPDRLGKHHFAQMCTTIAGIGRNTE
jgi:hypothetical protein